MRVDNSRHHVTAALSVWTHGGVCQSFPGEEGTRTGGIKIDAIHVLGGRLLKLHPTHPTWQTSSRPLVFVRVITTNEPLHNLIQFIVSKCAKAHRASPARISLHPPSCTCYLSRNRGVLCLIAPHSSPLLHTCDTDTIR